MLQKITWRYQNITQEKENYLYREDMIIKNISSQYFYLKRIGCLQFSYHINDHVWCQIKWQPDGVPKKLLRNGKCIHMGMGMFSNWLGFLSIVPKFSASILKQCPVATTVSKNLCISFRIELYFGNTEIKSSILLLRR